MKTYEEILNLIISERKKRKLSLEEMASMGVCNTRTLAGYLYRERYMPIDVMFNILVALGYQLEIKEGQ